MNTEKIFIAGWRDGIRDSQHHLHWRIYRGDSTKLIAAREIEFSHQGRALPLWSASSKQASPQGFHVWFESLGRFSIDNDLGLVELMDQQDHPFGFSVRTASLYTPDDWNNWQIYDRDRTANVRSIVFRHDGRSLPLSTHSRKTPDARDLLAWLEVSGEIEIERGHAKVMLGN